MHLLRATVKHLLAVYLIAWGSEALIVDMVVLPSATLTTWKRLARSFQATGRIGLLLGCCYCLFLFLGHPPSPAFGQPKQESLGALRERTGQAVRVKVADMIGNSLPISNQDKRLLRKITVASEQRNWTEVMSLFGSHSGSSIQIYTAVMNAAQRCGKYKEGAKVYERCQQTCRQFQEPTFTAALKIFGRLHQPEKVRKIWAEAKETCKLSHMLVSSRIQAAADEGDAETAAEMLDLLNTSNLEINIFPITMAIRSCWGMGKTRHRAAKYFWELLPKFGVAPDIAAFTALVGSYTGAPLEYVLSTKVEMESFGIHPNRVFAETYLVSLLQLDFSRLRAISAIQDALQNVPSERLSAARRGIADFEAAGVEQTKLCGKLKTALERLKQ